MKPLYEMSEEEKDAFIKEFVKAVSDAMTPIVLSMADAAAQFVKAIQPIFSCFTDSGLIDVEAYLREEKKLRHRRKYQRMMERRNKHLTK